MLARGRRYRVLAYEAQAQRGKRDQPSNKQWAEAGDRADGSVTTE